MDRARERACDGGGGGGGAMREVMTHENKQKTELEYILYYVSLIKHTKTI